MEKHTYGPPETAAPMAKRIWRQALKEVKTTYPVGHPQLVNEAKRADMSQEETQMMIAQEVYLERSRKLLERWEEEYREEHSVEEQEGVEFK